MPSVVAIKLATRPPDTLTMSDYLFAQPSFLSGVGRLADLGGVFDDYNTSETVEQAETRAMRADWQDVGSDIRAATDSAHVS
jgi:hypothetical protein